MKKLVYKAVTKDPFAFIHVGQPLKGNKKIVLEAVKKRGYLLQHAAAFLRKDRAVIIAAITQNREAIKYVDNDMRFSPEIREVFM